MVSSYGLFPSVLQRMPGRWPYRTSGFEHRTDVRDHRHFGERDEKTAVGDVVHRRDDSVADQRAHEFAVATLRRKFRTLFRDFEVPTGGVGTFLFGGAPNR
jgi:hypothetical protein